MHGRVAYIAVIYPDIGRVLKLDEILTFRCDVQPQISQYDVACLLDTKPPVGQTSWSVSSSNINIDLQGELTGVGPSANDGGVAQNIENAATVNDARNLDHASTFDCTLQS